MSLNPKQARFVDEYLIDLNAKQAAIRAGYSERTAESQGSRLLSHAMVAAEVADRQVERSQRTGVTQDRVLEELARLAFSDVRAIFSEGGGLKHPGVLNDGAAAAIGAVEVVTKTIPLGNGEVDVEHTHKIKMWDKPRALEMLARHLGMFNDKLQVTVTDGLAERVRRAKERASGG
jgi:phage terminase small subunit